MNAVAEVVGLLKPGEPSSTDDAYLDVLGTNDAIGPHRNQQVFHRKGVPKIYERFWRPAVARYFFGLAGPGIAGESRIVMEMLGVRRGDRVLDVGCGPGNYTRMLAEASEGGLTVGLDASEAMVAAAAEQGGENLAYLRGDAAALPFEDETFDAACSVGVLHLVERPLTALAEMVRVLAPGGRLTVVVTCARKESKRGQHRGVMIFGRDEVTGALREQGMEDIEQQVIRRGQFVAARKPDEEGGSNGG